MRTCIVEHGAIDDTDCREIAVGAYCSVEVKVEKSSPLHYCMQNTPEGFKIDWRCSKGFNPTPLKIYKSEAMQTHAVFRVTAKASDYFNFHYVQEKYYSFQLKDADGENIWGYADRMSPEGLAIFTALKDGKSHAVMIELGHDSGNSQAYITRLAAQNWRQLPEEVGATPAMASASAAGGVSAR